MANELIDGIVTNFPYSEETKKVIHELLRLEEKGSQLTSDLSCSRQELIGLQKEELTDVSAEGEAARDRTKRLLLIRDRILDLTTKIEACEILKTEKRQDINTTLCADRQKQFLIAAEESKAADEACDEARMRFISAMAAASVVCVEYTGVRPSDKILGPPFAELFQREDKKIFISEVDRIRRDKGLAETFTPATERKRKAAKKLELCRGTRVEAAHIDVAIDHVREAMLNLNE